MSPAGPVFCWIAALWPALVSLIAHESQWVYVDNKVKEIKLKHFPRVPQEDIELHAKDMLNRDGVFKRLNWDEIYAIFDDIFGFLRMKRLTYVLFQLLS